jgi:hypothetical protein
VGDPLEHDSCKIYKPGKKMKITDKMKLYFGAFGEWASIVGPIFVLFLYVHHENVHLAERLDTQITTANQNFFEIHKRCDELHKEFYDLLKEKNK